MKRRACLPLLVLTTVVPAAFPATAQPTTAMPRMFVVHVERVMPSRLADYEATTREFISLVEQNHAQAPLFSFTTLQAEDLSYAYLAPVRSLAATDAINADFDALGRAVGQQKWLDLIHRNGATLEGIDENVFVEVPEASYWPPNAATTPQNARVYELDFYRVVPGMEDGAMQAALAWKDLFTSHQVPFGYSVFRLSLGQGMPLWVVSIPARDAADLATIQEGSRKAIGAEAWQAQMGKTLAITRGFEVKRYTVRPDLSLAPAGAMPDAP